MEIHIGDQFTEGEFEWEVVTHPAAFQGGKSLRARIRRRVQRDEDAHRARLRRARASRRQDSSEHLDPCLGCAGPGYLATLTPPVGLSRTAFLGSASLATTAFVLSSSPRPASASLAAIVENRADLYHSSVRCG
jgi:hypothetical protein